MIKLTASEAGNQLSRLIDETTQSHQPIKIAGEHASAILVATADWESIQETLYLLAIPGMRESIKAGMAEPLAQSATEVSW